MPHAVELTDVRKAFGIHVAVDGITLSVPRGGLYGIIGPSGAGKTTCIRMIMSILHPDSGTVSVLGHPSALRAKDRIGYLPEERGVYRRMRVGAFLGYLAQLKGLDAAEALARVPRLLERVGLGGSERTPCEELSKGMLQRVQFVGATIHEPDLLILDEPFSGLDPVSVRLLRASIAEAHARGTTILLSTHVMAYAEELCEHVVMIHRGKKVLDQPMAGLRRQFDRHTILIEPMDRSADMAPVRSLDTVAAVDPTPDGYRVTLREMADPSASMARIAGAIPMARIEISRLHLEDVFVREVSGGGDMDAAVAVLRAGLRAGGDGVTAT